MTCPICGKIIWPWQKQKVAGVFSAAEEVYMGHRDCVIEERKKSGKENNTTESFIDDMMGYD